MSDEETLIEWIASVGVKHGFLPAGAVQEIKEIGKPSPLVKDPTDDDFWKDLENRMVEGLRNWLNGTYDTAIEQFSDDLSKRSGGNPDAIAWSVTKQVLSMVPAASIPVNVGSIAIELANAIPPTTRNLEDFLDGQRESREALGDAIFNRNHEVCKQLEELAKSSGGNDAAFRSKADGQIRKGIEGLPSRKQIMKGMIDDWVNAIEDSHHWEWDHDGYVFVDAIHDQKKGSWKHREGPYIDDVERSAGVRQALEHAYGSGASLTQLPYPAKVQARGEDRSERPLARGAGRPGPPAPPGPHPPGDAYRELPAHQGRQAGVLHEVRARPAIRWGALHAGPDPRQRPRPCPRRPNSSTPTTRD